MLKADKNLKKLECIHWLLRRDFLYNFSEAIKPVSSIFLGMDSYKTMSWWGKALLSISHTSAGCLNLNCLVL